MHGLSIYSVVFILINVNGYILPEYYAKQRNAMLEEESRIAVGGKLQLSEEENIANSILMKWKYKEIDNSFNNPEYFNFSKHYFSYKNDIEKSKVYQIIRSMPKGAVLHVHSSLMLNASVLVKLTYMDHLYACYVNDTLNLNFSETIPSRPCPSEWTLVSDLRNASGDAAAFDAQLKNHFTLYKDDGEDYSRVDINTVWNRFDKVYYAIKSLISYRPAREKYWYETLKQFYNDNIMYLEVRSGLQPLYELDGSKHSKEYLVELYSRVTDKFIKDYPDFIGVKLIITSHRANSADAILETLNLTRKLKATMPDMIAGFDLIGQEDLGKPLKDFLPVLNAARNEIDFYLHAGETAWMGTSTDENLVDALLLGSKRIGHGYALAKHPILLSAVVKKDIALEVNVISNVVLSLVHDVRNHPLASYLAMGLPVVISSDDPGAWSAEPLSHDFFVTFMGVASKKSDLRMLKQLAINSITYSSLDEKRKMKLFHVFRHRWDQFLNDLIRNESLNWVVNITGKDI